MRVKVICSDTAEGLEALINDALANLEKEGNHEFGFYFSSSAPNERANTPSHTKLSVLITYK